VAAQIVTGVGFLGAGAIFREGAVVSGLTTAAGLWVVAAIGMAAGSGSYWLAGIGTAVTLATLYGLLVADAAIARNKAKVPRRLEVHVTDVKKMEALLKFIRRIDPASSQLDFKLTGEATGLMVLACSAENVTMVRELLASHRAVGKVQELSALYWPQGTGNRPDSDD